MTKKFPGEWIDEMAEVPPDAWPQPEALRLADAIGEGGFYSREDQYKAAAELRRLHSVNEQLLEALEEFVAEFEGCYADAEPAMVKARAAIAAAKGEA